MNINLHYSACSAVMNTGPVRRLQAEESVIAARRGRFTIAHPLSLFMKKEE